jgi:hypothetical protein
VGYGGALVPNGAGHPGGNRRRRQHSRTAVAIAQSAAHFAACEDVSYPAPWSLDWVPRTAPGFDGGSMKVPPGRGRRHVTRIRFMVEAGIDAVLWGESDQGLEDELAIPEDLRHRMKRWRREYDDQDGGVSRPWTVEEHRAHDRTGYEMSRELQEVLGPTYRVDYVFTTGEVRAEVRAETARDSES